MSVIIRKSFGRQFHFACRSTESILRLPTRSTRFSSVVTLFRPPTISSLKITDRSFRYASPRLWNQLPDSFRQPHHSCLDSPPRPLFNSSLSSSPLSSSITPSPFHSGLKTYLFNKSFPPYFFYLLAASRKQDWWSNRTYHAHHFIFSFSFTFWFFVYSVWWTKLVTRQLFTAR